MPYTLLLVESPSKAKKIESYLGSGYKVAATVGHLRDLPSAKGEVPKEIADKPWGSMGIEPGSFRMYYIVPAEKKKQVATIRQLVSGASEVILASDDDTEGESIAWHASVMFGLRDPKRIVFHEITKEALQKALQNPRRIDMNKVRAQETRRAVDRLVGWTVSPQLSRSMRLERLSAGRVQSMAVMLLAQRENERMKFRPASYWKLAAQAQTSPQFKASVVRVYTKEHPDQGQVLATEKHYGPDGQLKDVPEGEVPPLVLRAEHAQALSQALTGPATVVKAEKDRVSVKPPPPFITTTLQVAGGRIKLSVQRVTELAQALYDGGYITYIRTDSPSLSDEALDAARAQATQLFGPDAVPEKPRQYATRTKGAQEAHEAIRPAGEQFRTPAETGLSGDELALYTLIYNRTVASQMTDALYDRTRFALKGAKALMTAQGRVLVDPGFKRLYEDDKEAREGDDMVLPELSEGQTIQMIGLDPEGATTSAPGRLKEPGLVQALERLQLGRPSTYAAILKNIQEREYVVKVGDFLAVSARGLFKIAYLNKNLPELVTRALNAQMEEGLDRIRDGQLDNIDYLQEFWERQLGPKIQTMPNDLPTVRLHHLNDVVLKMAYVQDTDGERPRTRGIIELHSGGRKGEFPQLAVPADLTAKDVEAILDGTWKAPARKRSAGPKSASGKSKSGTGAKKTSRTRKPKTGAA